MSYGFGPAPGAPGFGGGPTHGAPGFGGGPTHGAPASGGFGGGPDSGSCPFDKWYSSFAPRTEPQKDAWLVDKTQTSMSNTDAIQLYFDVKEYKYQKFEYMSKTGGCQKKESGLLFSSKTHYVAVLTCSVNEELDSSAKTVEYANMVSISKTFITPMLFIVCNSVKNIQINDLNILQQCVEKSKTAAPKSSDDHIRFINLFFSDFDPNKIEIKQLTMKEYCST